MNEKSDVRSPATVLPYAWVVLVIVYLASVAGPLNQTKVPPLMPVLMDAFQLELGQAGWLMSVFALTGLVLALPAGVFLPRIGPKVMGLIATGCLALGAALGALSTGAGLFLVSRVIEGIGMGLIAVVAPAAIAMWFPSANRGGPMGIWATWVPVGSVSMYVLAPVIGSAAGWQAVWWLGAGFALLALILYGLLMRLPPWLADASDGTSAAPPLNKILANKAIWLLGLEFGCFNLVFISLGTFYPTYLSEVRDYSLAQASLIASLSSLVILVSAPLAGWVSDRIGSRRLLFSIPFIFIALLMLFPFRLLGWHIFVFMGALGLVTGAIPTATFSAAPEIMGRPDLAGLGLAVVMVGQNLGMFVGPILFGNLVEGLGWAVAGYWLIPVCILGFLAAWRVKVR
ncbi:MAG: MFS transporter [Anaerolineales bacterium]|jgi:MFS family permease